MRARLVVALFALIATLLSSGAWAHKPTVTTFTYNADIFPIFAAKCGSCHRTGGVAPMSLLTYKEAYPWGVSIKNEVLNLQMPPWFADDRYGVFKHDAGLTAKEMDTIVDWCLGGSPEGETPTGDRGADPAGWPLGDPELVLSMPSPVVLDEATSELVETIAFETGLTSDAYISAVDLRPGSPNVVRSATVHVGGSEQPVATWIPGQSVQALPEGTGHPLPAGATIELRVHYRKTWLDEGVAVEDRSALAIYLVERAAPVASVAVSAGASHVVDSGGELVALLARVDAPVETVTAELVRPDGSREGLLRLYQPSPEWPRKYWLEEPMALPPGSRIEVSTSSPEASVPTVVLDLIADH